MKKQPHIFIFISIAFIIPLIVLNLFTYNDNLMVFDPCNLCNLFSCSGVVYRDGFRLFLSMFAIFSLFTFYWKWKDELRTTKIADINGLLEELHHNINLTDEFLDYNKSSFYPSLLNELEEMKKTNELKYPSPCDFIQNQARTAFYNSLIIFKTPPASRSDFIKLREDFITSAITSKTYFTLKSPRIFYNLGHLHYSINRHNLNVDRYNSGQITFQDFQTEFFYWVHFRLHYQLLELITTTESDIFIDKKFVEEIKSYLPKKN